MATLASIKVGDQVIRSWGREDKKLFEVARITPRHIALQGSHDKWRVSDGGIVNGGKVPRHVQPDRIQPYDEAVWLAYVHHVAHLAQISDLHQYDWGKLSDALIRKMHALLPADTQCHPSPAPRPHVKH